MKKKCFVIAVMVMIIGTIIYPAIAKNTLNLENENKPLNIIKEKSEIDKNFACIGYIYGTVGNSHGVWSWSPYPFALVTNGKKWVICGVMGQYSMTLSLNHEYNLTAHVTGFKPLTKHIYLTDEEPNREITFDMYGREYKSIKLFENSDDSKTVSKIVKVNYFPLSFISIAIQTEKEQTKLIKNEVKHSNFNTISEKEIVKNPEKSENLGKIYGYIYCSHGVWTWDPVSHAIVRIGLRLTISDSNGYFEITGLPLNRTYRVVANHLFYYRNVEKVVLTEEKPEKNLYIDMQLIFE